MNRKIFNRSLWQLLSLVFLSFFVVFTGGYEIAMSQSAAINHALGIQGSGAELSSDEKYQYFKSDYGDDEYDRLSGDFLNKCEELESEGLVLLKNDNNALPLAQNEKVSCFLTSSVKFNYASSGSSAAKTEDYDNLKSALEGAGLTVNSELWSMYESSSYGRYKKGTTTYINEMPYSEYTESVKSSFNEYSTAIVTLGRDSGEGSDIIAYAAKCDGEGGNYLRLSENERNVLKELTALKKTGKIKKIIVILNTSACIQLDFLFADDIDVDSCLWTGNVGKSGIKAVAGVLTGQVNPSGKLSDTYLKDNLSSPAMASEGVYNETKGVTNYNFAHIYSNYESYNLNETQMYYGVYNEGIYVGYRYYETRYYDYVTGRAKTGNYDYSGDVAYPFGYGLSYSSFTYSDFSVTEKENSYEISVKVTNSGTCEGKEGVGIYLKKPYTQYDINNGVEKSAAELCGIAKSENIKPGESETIKVMVEKERFKSYDRNGAKTYIVDEGDYYFAAGNGVHDALNNILAAEGCSVSSTSGRMDSNGNPDLAAKVTLAAQDRSAYAVSSAGSTITNLFDDADPDKYAGSSSSVTYVTRSDWEGTFPKGASVLTVTEKLAGDLASNKEINEDPEAVMPSYGEKNGLTLAALRGKPYDDPDWDKLLNQMTYGEQSYLLTNAQYSVVGISSVGKPAERDSDGPTGIADSKSQLSFPSEGIWASTFNLQLIKETGNIFAEEARANNYQGIYANGVNIHRTPYGGRSHEYFSEDGLLSGLAAQAEIQGIQEKGVITYVKHFAFNDQEAQRNGICVWLNEQEAREIMLLPFEYAMSAGRGNSHAMMTSFTRVGAVWAGAHSHLLIDLAHGEWGFDGFNITDMASSNGALYMTFKDGIVSGTDCFLGSGSESALDEFKTSATYACRMRDASHRVLYVTANFSCAMNGLTPDTEVTESEWWWRTAVIIAMAVTAVLSFASVIMLALSEVKAKK